MYSGKNPSAKRSMEWLDCALLSLLEEKKFDKISVKELCERADLSRQTFYQLFDCTEDVLEYHFSKLFTQFAEKCDSFQEITIELLAYHFFDFFYEHKKFVFILVHNNLPFMMEKQFEIYLKKINLFESISKNSPFPDYEGALIAGALTSVLMHWFDDSFRMSIEELSRLTVKAITGQALTEQKDNDVFRTFRKTLADEP